MRRVIVDCAVYQDGRRIEGPADFSAALDRARAARNAFLWIGLYEPTEEEFAMVSSDFGLHPLAVEDALSAHQRPKLEVYEDSLFLVLKPVQYEDKYSAVTTGELMVFVGDCFVVTVRHGEANPLGVVRERLERTPEVLRHGPTAVMYAVADAVVDHYLEVADELHIDLDELEADVFSPESGRLAFTAGRIYSFKRQVLEFRRAAGPLDDPMARLAGGGVPFVHAGSRPFFRDVGDHLTRANEHVDGLDRLLSDVLAAHLAQVGVRQNDDVRKISAWAAMIAVPTMLAGIYGMNFDHMPELAQPWGYPAVLVLMVGSVLLLHRFFKRRGWL
ncbi:magnesium and cobalt transport protein CorA [Streptomyces sp. XD-27]|uniref:magnesium and cobalt transport protein CorA n=1 Tax=Streptomyces sp. XD-27 TaxID=3062779 RepID=UPI0026F469F8|nr:magnesium and cobalt transport protein CorA [Streptomyces sp. XD-27]WKX74147.1 magnesium and cobalt transport protein CorA [Streptomyces sp. XD-27]